MAFEDRDTITIDRQSGIDGPAHRFIVKRYDDVEVCSSPSLVRLGEVLDIDHDMREVTVRFPEYGEKQTVPVEDVYPASESTGLIPKSIAELESRVPSRIRSDDSEAGLIRPDRQISFPDAVTHFDWPAADSLHDRDTITVDRVSNEGGALPHRFIIKRGDTVDAWFSNSKIETGTVVGISHRRREVKVLFPNSTGGIDFHVGQIYPAKEPEPKTQAGLVPVTVVVDKLNERHGKTITEADRLPSLSHPRAPIRDPYTFESHKAFVAKLHDQSVTIADVHEGFSRLLEGKDEFILDLIKRFKAPDLKVLAARLGDWNAKSQSKNENAESIYRRMLHDYHFSDSFSYQMGQDYFLELSGQVLSQTADDLKNHFCRRTESSAAREKELLNPETISEFRTFIREKGESQLSNEQLAQFDRLHADASRKRRKEEKQSHTVEKFESGELSDIEFTITEGFHTKKQIPLFIVQIGGRVERSTFSELKTKAKMIGGWYSSFVKDQSGFQFYDRETADRFVSLSGTSVDRTDVLQARKTRKELNASERLHELAAEMLTRAEESIEASKNSLQNTARRADIQAGVRGRAYASQTLARSIHSIAEALSNGEANYLDGIRHRTQIEALDTVLYLARWARVRAIENRDGERSFAHAARCEKEEGRPYREDDIRHATYPFPSLSKRQLYEAIEHCKLKPGQKQSAARMEKRLRSEKEEYVTFQEDYDIQQVSDFISRAKSTGFDTDYLQRSVERFSRLRRANIFDIHELRAALREYLPHTSEVRGDDPVSIAERELIGKKLPGFFPTPPAVVAEMLELAAIGRGDRILEPSCGKGDIVQAIQREHPESPVTAIEFNRTLEDVLGAKGIEATFGDFLEHFGQYDRAVMNPPFENGADIDHVRHAYGQLADGGRLVSVMSEGPFFREDKKATAFRKWLDKLGGKSVQLTEDAFNGHDAFRQTGVRARLVVIDRE
ncbi:MAG: hypothetical protein KDB00_02970 [Planctomycetales bacterium]|nr:hypothetical protein [Planctomycetales bacterium]